MIDPSSGFKPGELWTVSGKATGKTTLTLEALKKSVHALRSMPAFAGRLPVDYSMATYIPPVTSLEKKDGEAYSLDEARDLANNDLMCLTTYYHDDPRVCHLAQRICGLRLQPLFVSRMHLEAVVLGSPNIKGHYSISFVAASPEPGHSPYHMLSMEVELDGDAHVIFREIAAVHHSCHTEDLPF